MALKGINQIYIKMCLPHYCVIGDFHNGALKSFRIRTYEKEGGGTTRELGSKLSRKPKLPRLSRVRETRIANLVILTQIIPLNSY